MMIDINQIHKGERWIIRPEDGRFCFMVEVLSVASPSRGIRCKVIQTWAHQEASTYYLNQEYVDMVTKYKEEFFIIGQ